MRTYEIRNGYAVFPYGISRIEANAFCDCSELTHVIIPDSVSEIDDHAFCRCTGLSHLVIPDGVTRIGVGRFGVVLL